MEDAHGTRSQLGGSASNEVAGRYFDHSSGQRVDTDAVIYEAIKREHPGLHVVVTPVYSANLQAYASTGGIEVQTLEHKDWPSGLKTTVYVPPAKRLDGGNGGLAEIVRFEKFLYHWNTKEFLVYLVDGRDGQSSYPRISNQYIVSDDPSAVASLIKSAGAWTSSLHEEIWVFDSGFWQKDPALYQAISKSHWEDVILDHSLKEDLIDTIQRFFDSREQYRRLAVPWKRGLIFYGPPGNGKTISIKATMHTLYKRDPPVPTLYVKSLKSFFGAEYSISQIFGKARQEAPCYLVFEDLDSMVTPDVRSFFLNAVDGLSENEGVMMIGSTNHIDQLDPGLAKRPSRFDRKYLFPDPNKEQRTRYAEYWQKKLSDNKDIDFPDKLCPAIAGITE